MLTFEQRKAAVSKALEEIEKGLEQMRWRQQAAKNWAAMTPAQRKVITDKLARLELNLAIFQATLAARPRPVARKDTVNLQAQELLQRSRARKTAPTGCSGIVCGHMRTPTGGRR